MSDREPTMLLATKLYSTFQLCCSVFPNNESYSIHDVFNKVILYIIDWFRFRARGDVETTGKIAPYPKPDNFHEFDLASLPNIKIREAFTVNTLYLPDQANWAIRINEPDNHAEFRGQDPGTIIHGRSFITNIAIRENEEYVTLSYKCACKEPKTNTRDCKAFRPRFLKDICRDKNLLLKELSDTDAAYDRIWELCISIESNSLSNHLAQELVLNEKRQMPVLFFTGNQYDDKLPGEMAEKLMGYCHVFRVSDRQFNRLFKARLLNNDVEIGDIVFYRNGLDYEVIDIDEESFDNGSLVSSIQRYPIRKSIDYRNTLFYREAKTTKFEIINSNDPTELLAQVNQQKDTIEENYKKIREITADADELQEQLRSSRNELRTAEDLYESIKTLYSDALTTNEDLSQKINYFKVEAAAYKTLLQMVMSFPSKKEEIGQWIKSNFSGQILLLERAENSLQRYNKPLNIKMLCSAIVYLNAYVLCKRGQISEEELSFYRIEKPWDIALCGDANVNNFSEYKIDLSQYGVHEKKDYLTFHLKSGNKADNLLRIYFSINDEMDRIIIGHLPDHLPTMSRSH